MKEKSVQDYIHLAMATITAPPSICTENFVSIFVDPS